MPSYRMTASEFVKKSRSADIDYMDFGGKLMNELRKANRKFSLLREVRDVRKGVVLGPTLFGLPLVVGDGICMREGKSTAGSLLLKGYEPDFDADIIAKLRDNSAAFVGMAHQDALGLCRLGTRCAHAQPKNPLDAKKAAGCCSAAGAVAATEMPLLAVAHASCGGICSAVFCKSFAFLPGSFSSHGLIEGSGTLDRLVFYSRKHDDFAALSGIAFNHLENAQIRKIAVMNSSGNDEMKDVAERFRKSGIEVRNIRADFSGIEKMWINIMSFEAMFNSRRYAAMKLGRKTKMEFKTSTTAYKKSLELLQETRRKMQGILAKYDIVASPAMLSSSPAAGEAQKLSLDSVAMLHSPSLPDLVSRMPMVIVPGREGGIALAGKNEGAVLEAAKILEG